MFAESFGGADRSYRADMTGQRGPRQAVASPASTIAAAPARAAARQGAPARIARPGPAMTISWTAPPEDAPLVVEPPSGPTALARAAASTAWARSPARTAAAAPAPSTASRTPAARLSTDLVAITAAAPASSTSVNSLRILEQHVSVEAGPVAGVAGGADLVDLDHQGVSVAVKRDGLDPLAVPGGVALHPVFLAAAGPVGAPAGGEGAMQRLVVHPAEHQHLAGVVLLGDGRDQSGRVPLQPCRDGRVKHRSLFPRGSGGRPPG